MKVNQFGIQVALGRGFDNKASSGPTRSGNITITKSPFNSGKGPKVDLTNPKTKMTPSKPNSKGGVTTSNITGTVNIKNNSVLGASK